MVAGPQLRRPDRRAEPPPTPSPAEPVAAQQRLTPDRAITRRRPDDRPHRAADDRPQPPPLPPGTRHGRRRRLPRGVHRDEDRRVDGAVDRRRRIAPRRPRRPRPPARSRRRADAEGRQRPAEVRQLARLHRPRRRPARPASTRPGSSPTLEEFKKKYKVDVDYQEKIGDNATFVETIKPALVGGLPTGWDLIVLTDWMASKIVASGWAEKIDQANVPNCTANLRDALKNSSWDADAGLPLPVAVGHDRASGSTPRRSRTTTSPEPTKIADLWNIPADKMTFLSEARDTFGLVLLKLGVDADGATVTAGAAPAGGRRHPAARRRRACASPATSTSRTSARRRSGRRSSGPATSPRRAARTTSSSSPRRGR